MVGRPGKGPECDGGERAKGPALLHRPQGRVVLPGHCRAASRGAKTVSPVPEGAKGAHESRPWGRFGSLWGTQMMQWGPNAMNWCAFNSHPSQVHAYPADARLKDKDGRDKGPFWSGHKKFPTALRYDGRTEAHWRFLVSTTHLVAQMVGAQPRKMEDDDSYAAEERSAAFGHAVAQALEAPKYASKKVDATGAANPDSSRAQREGRLFLRGPPQREPLFDSTAAFADCFERRPQR